MSLKIEGVSIDELGLDDTVTINSIVYDVDAIVMDTDTRMKVKLTSGGRTIYVDILKEGE